MDEANTNESWFIHMHSLPNNGLTTPVLNFRNLRPRNGSDLVIIHFIYRHCIFQNQRKLRNSSFTYCDFLIYPPGLKTEKQMVFCHSLLQKPFFCIIFEIFKKYNIATKSIKSRKIMDITLLFFTHSHFLLFSDEYSNQITCYSLISIHNEQQINKLNQHRMNTNQQKNCTLMLKHTSECHSHGFIYILNEKKDIKM